MYLVPLPGADRAQLIGTLRQIATDLINLRGQTNPATRRLAYSTWVVDGARLLRRQLRAPDIEQLLFTDRYRALQGPLNDVAATRLLELELDDRRDAFEAAIGELEAETRRWSSRPGHIVVPDTSVFCQHPDKIEDLDFADMLGLRDTPIRIVLPILVLDELDNRKSRGRDARWRPAYTLAFLDGILDDTGYGTVRKENYSALEAGEIPRGTVTVEISFDPPGHQRLPTNDDELVDRALAIQAGSGRPLTFVTYDTGQSTRARLAGLKIHKLRDDPGPEPESGR